MTQFREKLITLKSSNLIYINGSEGNFINICVNNLVGTNYLLIDIKSIIKDNFISKAAEKGCSAILFKNFSKFDGLKKDTIKKYLESNIHKKIKIIFIDEVIEKVSIGIELSQENILHTPDFSKNKDLIPDFSLAILNFYLSMNRYLGYKEF